MLVISNFIKNFKKHVHGFSLIELLVVIAIIVILSAVGLVIFTNIRKASHDSRRKADIDAIAKAMEVNYSGNGSYQPLQNSQFANGAEPKPPEGGDYNMIIAADNQSYRACAALEGNPTPTCDAPSETCFCRNSSFGEFVAPTPTPSPTPTATPTPIAGKYIFVTSASYTGDLGGLAGADAKCQTAAAGLPPDTYKAWLSGASISASTRITDHATIPYKRVDEVIVDNNWSDLTDLSKPGIINPINVAETGDIVNSCVWTNTSWVGGLYSSAITGTCDSFTRSQSGDLVLSGLSSSYTDYKWTQNAVIPCTNSCRLYCVQD